MPLFRVLRMLPVATCTLCTHALIALRLLVHARSGPFSSKAQNTAPKSGQIYTFLMAAAFPFSHVACPCTSLTTGITSTTEKRRSSYQPALTPSSNDPANSTFNPHDPRANYSLYPYEHLLYCDECHQIRCPRCWTEEIMNWFCPSCLFEVPSSVVKSDGNRYGKLV